MTNPDLTPRPTVESPTKRLIKIALTIVDMAIRDGICPLCLHERGGHGAGCLVGEAVVFDPAVRRQAMAQETDHE